MTNRKDEDSVRYNFEGKVLYLSSHKVNSAVQCSFSGHSSDLTFSPENIQLFIYQAFMKWSMLHLLIVERSNHDILQLIAKFMSFWNMPTNPVCKAKCSLDVLMKISLLCSECSDQCPELASAGGGGWARPGEPAGVSPSSEFPRQVVTLGCNWGLDTRILHN